MKVACEKGITMTTTNDLLKQLQTLITQPLVEVQELFGEVTMTCSPESVAAICQLLRDEDSLQFNMLIDLCAVDYLTYGHYDWSTESATGHGFSRAVEPQESTDHTLQTPRFAVVYHLLSTVKNHRVRVKTFLDESSLTVHSVHHIWAAANWFEREAYDLFGILFEGHPDLRRILTDYGFIGHPFRKDFPTSGHVEMRYDAQQRKVIYEPVDIVPRVLVPKVIRHDNRYLDPKGECHD